jgi:hypothetical protein
MAEPKIFIGCVTFERDEQYWPLFLERLRDQAFQDWTLHIIDTTRATKPDAVSFVPRLREMAAAALPGRTVSVDEYAPEPTNEWKWYILGCARDRLRKEFLMSDATHYFSLDTDLLLSPEALAHLLSDNLPLVSGVFLNVLTFKETSRGHPVTRICPVAWIPDAERPGELVRGLQIIDVMPPRLIPLSHGSIGCALFQRSLLERFDFIIDDTERPNHWSEDIYLFRNKLAPAGIIGYLDTRVKCAHLKYPLGDPRNAHLDFAHYRVSVRPKT